MTRDTGVRVRTKQVNFRKKICGLFAGTYQTVHYIRMSVERGSNLLQLESATSGHLSYLSNLICNNKWVMYVCMN